MPVVGVAKGPDRNAGREVFHMPGGREVTLASHKTLREAARLTAQTQMGAHIGAPSVSSNAAKSFSFVGMRANHTMASA